MKKLILLALVSVWFHACTDDEGNYDYVKVNEVSIHEITVDGDTVDGINTRNVIGRMDTVRIVLDISGTIAKESLEDYDMEWYICTNSHTHTTISKEKNLEYPVDLDPGQYALYFQITDRSTGLKWLESCNLTVATPFSRGFLVLGDLEDGDVGLDMIAMPVGKDTTMIEDVFDNSEKGIKAPAERLIFAGQRAGDEVGKQALWMTTGTNSFRMSNQTNIDVLGEASTFGFIETLEEHKEPIRVMDMFPRQTNMNRSALYRGYITEDQVYFKGITMAEFFTIPVNRYSATSKTYFKPYPLAFYYGISSTAYNCVLLYDMDNDKFAKINGTSTASYCYELTDQVTDPFPWDQSKVKRTIVYGENSASGNNGSSFAIMKNKEGDSQYYIYKWDATSSMFNQRIVTKGDCFTIDMSKAKDIDKAKLFAFASNQSRLLYAVGKKLYVYDYGRESLELYEKDLDAEITYMETEYASRRMKNEFFVATYSPASKGTIYKMEIGDDPNKIEITERPRETWGTRLKVCDIEWKYTP